MPVKRSIEDLLLYGDDDPPGFKKCFISSEIGYGIFTTKPFEKNSFLLEYRGIYSEAVPLYGVDSMTYIFYFKHNEKKMCIDATMSPCMARFVNDAPEKFCNVKVVKEIIDGLPRLFLKAKCYIPTQMELRYDYLDRKDNLRWRLEKRHLLEPFTLEEVRKFKVSDDDTIKKIRPLTASQVLTLMAKGHEKHGNRKSYAGKERKVNNREKSLNSKLLPTETANNLEKNNDQGNSTSSQLPPVDSGNSIEKVYCQENAPSQDHVLTSAKYTGNSKLKKSDNQRQWFKCVVKDCEDEVRNLPRHLNGRKHRWSEESADAAVSIYKLRKKYCYSDPSNHRSSRDESSEKCYICPVPGCYSIVRRVDHHLATKKHKIKVGPLYRTYMKSAKLFDPKPAIEAIESGCSPRKYLDPYKSLSRESTANKPPSHSSKQLFSKPVAVPISHNDTSKKIESTTTTNPSIKSLDECNVQPQLGKFSNIVIDTTDGYSERKLTPCVDKCRNRPESDKYLNVSQPGIKCQLSNKITTTPQKRVQSHPTPPMTPHQYDFDEADFFVKSSTPTHSQAADIPFAIRTTEITPSKPTTKYEIKSVGECNVEPKINKVTNTTINSMKENSERKLSSCVDKFENKRDSEITTTTPPKINLNPAPTTKPHLHHDDIDKGEYPTIPTASRKKYPLRRRRAPSKPHNVVTSDDEKDSSDPTYSPYDDEEMSDVSCHNDPTVVVKPLPTWVPYVLEAFLSYLKGPDCTMNEGHRQCVANIKEMIQVTEIATLDQLYSGTSLRTKYVQEYCHEKKNLAPETIKTYLLSLQHFLSFLVLEKNSLQINTDIDLDEILQFKVRLTAWRQSYGKQSRIRSWEKHEQNLRERILPEDKQKYDRSKNAMHARALLSSPIENAESVNRASFVCVRDYLIAKIHFGSGHRSGVTANALVSEFESKFKNNDGTYTFLVRKHKTLATSGPAKVNLTAETFRELEKYVNVYRSFVQPEIPNIFVSWAGKKMKSGAISHQIHSQWLKAGLFDDQKPFTVTCTKIRQAVVTGVREQDPAKKQIVADLMAHSVTTGDNHYYMREQMKAATEASAFVRNYFDGTNEANESPAKKRKVWTEAEKKNLNDSFQEEITNEKIDMKTVKEKHHELDVVATERQIYDHVRSKIRKKRCTRENKWLSHHLEALRRCCSRLIEGESINDEKMSTLLRGTCVLKDFYLSQIQSRLQYERLLYKKARKKPSL